MSSLIAAILKATVGLLVNNGRNVAAEKLKEGNVTNEQLHMLIVRELDDIKKKVEGLATKDLLTCFSFYHEGLVHLYHVKPKEADGRTQKTQQEGVGREAMPLKQDVGSSEASVKTVSLAEEMRSLQLTDRDNSSARALNDAKDRFKKARQKATEAFYNKALSTSDRILAMQYRIMATILEKVDRLNDALAACRLCLEELHSMPVVKESLYLHLQPGFMALFHKTEREDIIRSVCRVNRLIFRIAEIVEEDTDISLWPCIDCGEEKVDPLRDVRVTETIEKEDPQHFLLKTWPFFQEGEEMMNFMPRRWFITINSKGQLMIAATDVFVECALLKLFNRNGNLLQSLHLNLPVTGFYLFRRIISIASDRANNVFILIQGASLTKAVTVIVFDQQANFQHEFDTCGYSIGSCIAVSDDSKVFVSAQVGKEFERGCVLVYNFNGVLLNIIQNASLGPVIGMTSIDSEGGRIMVLGRDLDSYTSHYVYQFSEQGNFLSRHYVSSNGTGQMRFLHKTEHVVELDFFEKTLFLYHKDGMIVREIKLKLSAFNYLDSYEPEFTVTTQGLVAMLTIEKGTGRRMIVIL